MINMSQLHHNISSLSFQHAALRQSDKNVSTASHLIAMRWKDVQMSLVSSLLLDQIMQVLLKSFVVELNQDLLPLIRDHLLSLISLRNIGHVINQATKQHLVYSSPTRK